MLSRRALIFATLFLVSTTSQPERFSASLPLPDTSPLAIPPPPDPVLTSSLTPQRRHRVAIATTYGVHMDVYTALAWTFQRVMNRSPPGGTVEAYAPPFIFNFQTIVERLGLYHGVVNKPDALINAINADVGENEEAIDIVVLGTCEIDLKSSWGESLLSAWDARDPEHKFTIVCLVHNGPEATPQQTLEYFSRRNGIRIMTISAHVASAHRRSFLARDDSLDPAVHTAN
ncbi:hypothetical protein MSAN_00268300 [Mycena sanguinolenta]|uniref:Uncharacterized protein n=1 Tax=Mycena sanguinolenta TaxID=230812 RepID=A0A8H7DM01_9AGAR|nr:hypothetical protein MSAN_00268300 [Mycena sanguinolenta]